MNKEHHDIENTAEITLNEELSQPATELSPIKYRKLIWKLDLHLLPPIFALWFVSLIDRINIGSANIFGLQKDLHMNPKSNDFNIALIIVVIGLITFELPSNYLLKKTSPSKVLAAESLLLGESGSQPNKYFLTTYSSYLHNWRRGRHKLHGPESASLLDRSVRSRNDPRQCLPSRTILPSIRVAMDIEHAYGEKRCEHSIWRFPR
jgi:hypothetical protein